MEHPKSNFYLTAGTLCNGVTSWLDVYLHVVVERVADVDGGQLSKANNQIVVGAETVLAEHTADFAGDR